MHQLEAVFALHSVQILPQSGPLLSGSQLHLDQLGFLPSIDSVSGLLHPVGLPACEALHSIEHQTHWPAG